MRKVTYCIGVNEIGQPIYITHYIDDNSRNTNNRTRKNVKATNKPTDSYNHLIDALSYATDQQKPKSQGIRKIRF